MDYKLYHALDKIVEDFYTIEINIRLALATDPRNPNVSSSISRIRSLIEASMVNFETLDIQSDEYKMIVKEMRIEEIYKPGGNSILNADLYSTESLLELICLHTSLIDCLNLLKASLRINQ